MIFAFIGLIVLIIGFLGYRVSAFTGHYAGTFRLAGIAIIIFGLLTASVKQIDAGTVGVQSLFGKVDNRILESGLNVINPLVEVSTFDIKTQNYTMSGVHGLILFLIDVQNFHTME